MVQIKGSDDLVVQVQSTILTTTTSVSSTSFTDISGMSVTITPSSSSSKIWVLVNLSAGGGGTINHTRLLRNGTSIATPSAAGSRIVGAMAGNYDGDGNGQFSIAFNYVDSPATTSAVTYKLQGLCSNGSYPFYINRSRNDTDSSTGSRASSVITVWEIAT